MGRRSEDPTNGLLGIEELRNRVERLAAIKRPSASEGEAHAAQVIATELRDLGAKVNVERETVHGTYWLPIGLATAAGAIAALARRPIAAAVGALAAAAVADDLRAGKRLMRRLGLRRRTATNVSAEFGEPSAAKTILVVAHHDAARSGLVFHPELPRAPLRRIPGLLEISHTTPPTLWGAVLGPALVSLGAVTRRPGLRLLGALMSAGYVAAMGDIARRDVVPGANDNASGVAVLISLAHWLAAARPKQVRVVLLSTGSEESFMEGMQAYARRHFPALPVEDTSVICVDTVGSPHLLLLEGEGMLGIREYPKGFLARIRRLADQEGIFLWPNLRFRNGTDGFVALKAGYETAMIGSVDLYKVPTHYHWPTDIADNVHYGTVAQAGRLCQLVIADLDQRQDGSPPA